jgi:hypothetical protein
MRLLTYLLITIFLLSAVLALGLTAQTVPFTLRLEQNQLISPLPNGGTVVLSADGVSVPCTAALTITYTGTAGAVINEVAVLNQFNLPSTDFSVVGMSSLPLALAQNQSFTVTLRYAPTSSLRSTAQALFQYSEGGAITPITVNLIGIAPEFTYSYVPNGGNPTVLSPGGTILFPPTPVGSTTSAVIVAHNKGSGPGVVNNIACTGSSFQPTGLPLPPATVASGGDLKFTVNYTPTVLETSQGTLVLALPTGNVTFPLQGSGTGPLFMYEAVIGSTTTSVQPQQVISMPDTPVNGTTTVLFRVRNTGNATGQVTTISVSGSDYHLSGLPFLPLTLAPGASATFSVSCNPSQPGQSLGQLLVGSDTFNLTTQGLGPLLAYSYTIGSVTTSISSGGTVLFAPTPVGMSTSLVFTITNNGTAQASITSLSMPGASPVVFTLSGLPALPLNIDPQTSASFTIQFSPQSTGTASATLAINSQTFTVSGIGNAPTPLPGYQFVGASGAQDPVQQPSIGLTLSSAYPLPLTGTLTLTFASDGFSDDPNVQFATGGRTVSFTIPANTTNAVFPNGTNQIRLQTGTVAGAITITPTFATASGIDLTPASPQSLILTIPQSPPQILNVQLTSKTATGFSVVVTGFSTSRSVTHMGFQFVPVSGENVATTTLDVNVESSFLAWYQGSTSKQYGSLFTATIPFTMQGSTRNVTNLSDTIQSVSVTLTNKLGSSAASSVGLH